MQMRPLDASHADESLKRRVLFGSTARLVADALGMSGRRQNSCVMVAKKQKHHQKDLKVAP